jgi:hypothetical protein
MLKKPKKESIMKKCYVLLLLPSLLYSVESEEPKVKSVELSGYINGKAFWDTRQVVGTAEDQTVFFPKPIVCSPTGDINSNAHCQVLPFETRMRLTIQEPCLTEFTSCIGVVEVEFRGRNRFTNLLNMRHAFGQLTRYNSTFIFGQTWHPLNVDELIPNTVSFNSGRPFAVYNRSPQLRYTYHAPSLDIILYAGSQVDFTSDGPVGLSTLYIRNALIPNLDFQLKGFFGDHVVGAGIDYQRIAPRIVSDKGYKVHEDLSSVAGIWFLGLNWPCLQIKNTLMFGGNLSNYGVLGGYAVEYGTTNPITGKEKYTNLRTLSAWSDVTIDACKYIETGFFIGAAKNYGSAHQIVQNRVDSLGNPVRTSYGLGNDIDKVFRISPRIRVHKDAITFAGEIEYTRAWYGDVTCKGTVMNTKPVANTQFLFSTFLYF